jgi:mannose-1-phosphate guanylyltransferase/mannose-6-phosphate isomerase
MVKPGASLSLQMHHHRAEHWIVVSGTAEVTQRAIVWSCWPKTRAPTSRWAKPTAWQPGQGAAGDHRGAVGSYLGEDDIVRFEDTYGRQ